MIVYGYTHTYNTHKHRTGIRNTQILYVCLQLASCSSPKWDVPFSHFPFAVAACKANSSIQLRWATVAATTVHKLHTHTFYLFTQFSFTYHLCKMKWFTKQLGIFIMLIMMLWGESCKYRMRNKIWLAVQRKWSQTSDLMRKIYWEKICDIFFVVAAVLTRCSCNLDFEAGLSKRKR